MNLIIANVGIKQDSEGRYCLNDLHKSAGGEKKHGPSYWMTSNQTKELIAELGHTGNPVGVVNDGFNNGTYVCKELVYAYAMWISPSFNLKVIRTFDSLQSTPQVSDPQTRALIQLLTEQDAIKQRVSLLEAKSITRDESFFTAAGFCNIKGIKLDRAGMAMVGKMAAQYSREHGLKMGKVYDSRYGEVNEYHTESLQYAIQA